MGVPTKVDLHVCRVTPFAIHLHRFSRLETTCCNRRTVQTFKPRFFLSLHTPRANVFHIPRVENFDSRFDNRSHIL
jgi:hypothetical protein